MTAKDIDLLKAVNDSDLSVETKRNYKNMCAAMVSRADGASIKQILMNPDVYIPQIKKWFPKITSYKVHLSTILGLFRYNKHLQTAALEATREKWSKAFNKADEEVTQRYKTNEPTERQKDGFVEYSKIIDARDDLPKGSIKRVLLGMYTYIKPMRCEYARIALYKSVVPDKGAEPNYILLKTGQLILRAFKTSKHHDSYDIELPDPLMDDIKKSLELQPRDWLFVNTSNEPYSHSTYTAWTLRTFLSIFKKPLTVSLIRHSYINTLDLNKLSIKEQEEIALAMGHTRETQGFYRLIFKKTKDAKDAKD